MRQDPLDVLLAVDREGKGPEGGDPCRQHNGTWVFPQRLWVKDNEPARRPSGIPY